MFFRVSGTMSSRKRSIHLSVRLDDKSVEQLAYLTAITGLSKSAVLRASVECFYQAKRTAGKCALAHIAPLIGRLGSGKSDLSGNRQRYVTQLLEQKHGIKLQK
jgi:Ribbon-helix-helix protein, copG family